MKKVTIENYDELRESLVNENRKITSNVLNDLEIKANEILKGYKTDFLKNKSHNTYRMPVLRDENIWNSDLYKFCIDLPKGSDLHVHGTSLLPMDRCIELIKSSNRLFVGLDDYKLVSKQDDKHVPLKYALDNKLIDYDDLFNTWTILGRQHKDDRWLYFENLFSYFEQVDLDLDVAYKYYLESFKYYLSLNIYHIEIHLLLDADPNDAVKTITMIKNAYFEAKKTVPYFTVRVICGGMKYYDFDKDDFLSRLNNTYKVMNQIKDDYDPNDVKDFVVGFDLINEEDRSRPLKSYAKDLLEFKKDKPNFNYYLHSGESLDPDSDNLIDAYLLDAKRVGHGFNLYQYPKLMDLYIKSEKCLEVCPISNQSLGYTTNVRNHPFVEYIKRGVTVSICSDDPMYMEHNSLVDDFFALIVCFDLDLSDIKQLCINSIMYSSLDDETKSKLIKHWTQQFELFIKKLSS